VTRIGAFRWRKCINIMKKRPLDQPDPVFKGQRMRGSDSTSFAAAKDRVIGAADARNHRPEGSEAVVPATATAVSFVPL